MPSPTVLLGALVAFLAALGVGFVAGQHVTEGRAAEAALVAATNSAKALADAQDRVDAAERKTQDLLAQADRKLQEANDANRKKLAAALAAAHDRGLYVRAECPDDHGAVPGAAAGPGRGDGAASVRLSDAASSFLLGLGAECDGIADQLRAAQAVIAADRGQ